MSRKNKNGKQDNILHYIALLTSITNLVAVIIEAIKQLAG